jgi:hypothetical protein
MADIAGAFIAAATMAAVFTGGTEAAGALASFMSETQRFSGL